MTSNSGDSCSPREEQVRARLLSRLEELNQLTSDSAGASRVVELDQSKVGRLSRMDAMQNQAMSQAAAERRRQSMRDIHAALKRMDEGVYGDCIECDNPINPKRLNHDPAVAHCIECATRLEQRV